MAGVVGGSAHKENNQGNRSPPSPKWRGTNAPIGDPHEQHIEWDWPTGSLGWRYAYKTWFDFIPFQQICRGPTEAEILAKQKEPKVKVINAVDAARALLSCGIGVHAKRQEPMYILPADDSGGLLIGRPISIGATSFKFGYYNPNSMGGSPSEWAESQIRNTLDQFKTDFKIPSEPARASHQSNKQKGQRLAAWYGDTSSDDDS